MAAKSSNTVYRSALWVIFLIVAVHPTDSCWGYRLGMLGSIPDWSSLEVYQETMDHSDFLDALNTIYLPYGWDTNLIKVYPDYALIRKNADHPAEYFKLRFTSGAAGSEEKNPAIPEMLVHRKQALVGRLIAIDPGHIGGQYSQMEERHFQIGEDPPVKEGDLTLRVSLKLKKELQALGAKVVLLRSKSEPVTSKRPEDFLVEANNIEKEKWLNVHGVSSGMSPWQTAWFKDKVRKRAEMLFYRVSEIQKRAKLVNEQIRPDVTLAVHFNVSPWPESTHQTLAQENHLHVIVHGTYTQSEFALDDVRLHLLEKLLSRNHETEIPLSLSVAQGLAKSTNLPPYAYGGRNASNQAGSPYLWARNLMANRLYSGPVVYLEAYCTNSRNAYKRIQMGDYEGLRNVNGTPAQSLFNEYVEGIVSGLIDYYSAEE